MSSSDDVFVIPTHCTHNTSLDVLIGFEKTKAKQCMVNSRRTAAFVSFLDYTTLLVSGRIIMIFTMFYSFSAQGDPAQGSRCIPPSMWPVNSDCVSFLDYCDCQGMNGVIHQLIQRFIDRLMRLHARH